MRGRWKNIQSVNLTNRLGGGEGGVCLHSCPWFSKCGLHSAHPLQEVLEVRIILILRYSLPFSLILLHAYHGVFQRLRGRQSGATD